MCSRRPRVQGSGFRDLSRDVRTAQSTILLLEIVVNKVKLVSRSHRLPFFRCNVLLNDLGKRGYNVGEMSRGPNDNLHTTDEHAHAHIHREREQQQHRSGGTLCHVTALD